MTATAAASNGLTKLRARVRLGAQIERAIAILLIIGLIVWAVACIVKDPGQTAGAFLTGVNNGTLYALIALGYTMVYGIIELINFAHGDLFMLGTVVAGNVFVNWLGFHDAALQGIGGLLASMAIAMVFCATLNVATEFIAYRRLRNAPKLAPLITAVGFSFIFQNIGQDWNGSAQKNWPINVSGPKFQGLSLYNLLLTIAFTVPLLLLMTWIVQRTKQGKAMRAVASDQDGARLMGINVNRTISFTFALGGALAGTAGALWIYEIGSNRYDLGLRVGLIAFTAAVLGGIGNLVGAVLGGILIGIIQAFNSGAPYGFGQQWDQTVIFTILIVLLVFKPEGLLGSPTTEKV
ncbi:MAG: branched-chain amino acid ABC transporter permease [Mycobacterium sp.]|nr:branched-chain amino acid ABC transporter permease [Mycobacterium sp.]